MYTNLFKGFKRRILEGTYIRHQIHRKLDGKLHAPRRIAARFDDGRRVDDSFVRLDHVGRPGCQVVPLERHVRARFQFDALLLATTAAAGFVLVPFAVLFADVQLREIDGLLDFDGYGEELFLGDDVWAGLCSGSVFGSGSGARSSEGEADGAVSRLEVNPAGGFWASAR